CLFHMSPILWLVLWLAGLQARPDSSALASIQGVVVRAGAVAAAAPEQLPQAKVELKPGNRTVMAGGSGTFSFRNLEPGQYTIFVPHDGYILQEDHKRGITAAGLTVTLAAGQELKNVVLPMTPAPVIIGRVYDPIGAPLATVLVRAYMRQHTPYGTRLK